MIDDRLEVVDILGAGGFSKVYRAQDVVEGEVRVLKLFNNASGYGAVRREAAALRKVRHPLSAAMSQVDAMVSRRNPRRRIHGDDGAFTTLMADICFCPGSTFTSPART